MASSNESHLSGVGSTSKSSSVGLEGSGSGNSSSVSSKGSGSGNSCSVGSKSIGSGNSSSMGSKSIGSGNSSSVGSQSSVVGSKSSSVGSKCMVTRLCLAGNDLVQLGAPVSDVTVTGTTPLSRVVDSTSQVSSVVTFASKVTSSSPQAVLVVVRHALNFSRGITSHGSTESTVAFPGSSFAVNSVSSGSVGNVRLAEAVLDGTSDGITEGSVVTVFPSSGVSVRESSSSSILDSTNTMALSSTASSVFTSTLFPLSSINGSLGELGSGHGGDSEGNNDGSLSHCCLICFINYKIFYYFPILSRFIGKVYVYL